MRVVSLLSSCTEIVCALGCRESLVGRSHECDFPAEIRSLPCCSQPRFPTDGTSYEIDQRIRALVAEALSIYRVDPERISELKPDLILTQMQCEVCAVSERDVLSALSSLASIRPKVVSVSPRTISECLESIRTIANALGVPEAGVALVASLLSGLQNIRARIPLETYQPRVVTIEWIDPLMTCGNWMPELIAYAGAQDCLGRVGAHSGVINIADIASADPDIILITPCGYDLATTKRESQKLSSLSAWGKLRAVQDGNVFIADGNQFFNRPGPRLLESTQIVAEICHPSIFASRGEHSCWERVSRSMGTPPELRKKSV